MSDEEPARRAYAKVMRRLLPFLSACFVLAYLDRLNIGFAKLQLAGDIHLSDTAYGFGAGIFFLGYLLLEVPGNLILARVGARAWIARIMILWGLVSSVTAFVRSPLELNVARFLLGAAEAGFVPGVIFYLTHWFPNARRARVLAFFVNSISVSGIIGGPLAGLILQHLSGAGGLRGWQWLFLLEGIPSVLAGIAALFILDNSVSEATWLAADERAAIAETIAHEARTKRSLPIARVFTDGGVWTAGLSYFCFCMGLYGISFWLPQLLKNAGAGDPLHIGLLAAIPYAVTIPAMAWIAQQSDACGKRRRYLALCTLMACVGLTISALHGENLPIALGALTLATVGVLAAYPLLWSISIAYLGTGNGCSAGIALINSLGASAGFISPYLIGVVVDATKSPAGGLLVAAASVGVGGVLAVARSPRRTSKDTVAPISMERHEA